MACYSQSKKVLLLINLYFPGTSLVLGMVDTGQEHTKPSKASTPQQTETMGMLQSSLCSDLHEQE